MTSETETKEMKITKVSQELFMEAVKTLPVQCSSMEFRMYVDESDATAIPYSLMEFIYRADKGLFVPDNFRIFHDKISESIQKLIEGGKFSELEIKSHSDPCAAFENFREENSLLDLMLSNDYKLTNGNIEGNYGNSDLTFSSGYMGGKRFKLTLGHKLADEDREKLVGWFKELEDKYQYKQGKLV